MICGFLSGRIIPDLGGHGFRWTRCVYLMVHDGVQYAWGSVMLAQLYHDMHLVTYREYASLSAGVDSVTHMGVGAYCSDSTTRGSGEVATITICG